jgi:hypothetical protein
MCRSTLDPALFFLPLIVRVSIRAQLEKKIVSFPLNLLSPAKKKEKSH